LGEELRRTAADSLCGAGDDGDLRCRVRHRPKIADGWRVASGDADDDAGADGAAALAEREAHAGLDADGAEGPEADAPRRALLAQRLPGDLERPGDVGGAEEELWPIAGPEGPVPPALGGAEDVELGLAGGVRTNGAERGHDLAARDLVAADAAEE